MPAMADLSRLGGLRNALVDLMTPNIVSYKGLQAHEIEVKDLMNSYKMATASTEMKVMMIMHLRMIEWLLYGQPSGPLPGRDDV